ncbi:amino acid ABC transporter substrate-binding protein [Haemophilus parahaemolyticus]|jgi:extracellular solute-binding protein family 3
MSFKTTAITTLVAATFILAGCDEKQAETAKAEATNKVLKVGSTGQSYPNGFKQEGKLVGFDVETTEAIAKELGYTVEWTTAEFSGLMGQLDSGRLDTVANAVAITDARKAKYHFTQPYSYYGSQIVTHKDNADINTYEDLKGKTISGVLGSNHLKNLQKQFPNDEVNVKTYETRDGAMYDLVYQRVDGYVNSKPILLAEIKRGNLPFKLVGEPLVIEEVGFPFEKNEKGEKLSQEFNQAIQKLKENGTLKSLSIKYYGEDITKPSK